MTPAALEIVAVSLLPLVVAAVARVLHPPRRRHLALVRASGSRPTGR